MTSPPKITAEWIVRAQLTISRPDNTSTKLRNANANPDSDTKYGIERHFDNENPIKVIYKWSTSDATTNDSSSIVETLLSAPTTANASNVSSKDSGSFRSTGVTSTDSGIGTASASVSNQNDKSKYRSTCNIVLTACTNVIPEPNEVAESFPTTYYTLFPSNEVSDIRLRSLPQQSLLTISIFSFYLPQPHLLKSNVSKQNILSVRDAFSQTSDIETKNHAAQEMSYQSHDSQDDYKSLHSNSKQKDERNTVRV